MAPRKHIDFDRVLETAVTLADEKGLDAVTLKTVAEQLGIQIPSLYNHISGLPGLRYAMHVWAAGQLVEQIRRAAVGKSGDAAVVSVAQAYRAFALAHPGVYPLTPRAAAPDQPELMALASELLDIVLAILEPYGFNEEEKLHAVRALRSVMHGFVDLEAAGGFGMNLDRDESFRQLVQLLVVGLRSRDTQFKVN
ncbi:MAG: WHG domain-containing protein [Chloroflexota bacterium]